MKSTKTETRTYLNPKHKAVQLNKKDGRLFFFYCISKGKETNRYYSKDNFEHENYFRLCFSINGYFAFVEFLNPFHISVSNKYAVAFMFLFALSLPP